MMKNLFSNLKFFLILLVVAALLAAAPAPVRAAPQCDLTRIDEGPPLTLTFSFRDSVSGLSAIRTVSSVNTKVDIPPLAPGTTSIVYVTVTQVNPEQHVSVRLEAESMDGSTTTCDYPNGTPPGDTAPPHFFMESSEPGPSVSVSIGIQDTASGLREVEVTESYNAQISSPSFTPGSIQPVILSAGQVTAGLNFGFTLKATDMAGNTGFYEYNHDQGDLSPPTWTVVSEEPGPPYTVRAEIQDSESGLKSISIVDSRNVSIVIPDFAQGITNPAVVITAIRESEDDEFAFVLALEDMAGNTTEIIYGLPIEDLDPPIWKITFFQAGPPASFQVSIQDEGSGLSSLSIIDAVNTTYSLPSFSEGSIAPVLISATQIEPNLDYQIRIEAVDMNGNRTVCDYPDSFQRLSRPEFDAVGDDHLSHFQDIYKARVIEQSHNSDGIRINRYSDFSEERFHSDVGVAMTDPCFSFSKVYESILTPSWTEAVYEWEITLQMKPISDLGLHLAGCVLRPGEESVWQAADQTGSYRLPTSPEVVRFIPSANPKITVYAFPGPSATTNFPAGGFNLDTRGGSDLARSPAVDVPFISRSLQEETLTLVLPNNGEVNASGQTLYALNAGDRIRITVTVPFNNTVDLRFGSDNAWLFYNGIVGTERMTTD